MRKRRFISALLTAALLISDAQFAVMAEDVEMTGYEVASEYEEPVQEDGMENEGNEEIGNNEETGNEETGSEGIENEGAGDGGEEIRGNEGEENTGNGEPDVVGEEINNDGEDQTEEKVDEEIEDEESAKMAAQSAAEDFQYTVESNNSATITGYTGNDSVVSIPASIEGHPVRTVGGNAFYGCTNLIEVELPLSVKTVGYSAFSSCENLTKITLNEGLESIGRNFIRNTAIKEIVIPKSVESMGYALGGVESLEKVIFENGMGQIPNNALSPEYSSDVMNVKEVVIPESVRTLGAGVFNGCSKMTGITLPESLKSIGSSTFSGCTSLAEISIPTGVTELGGSAFSGCISLSKIEMPGVKTVGGSVFWGCTSLTEVELPTSVKTVGSNAFSSCENLTKITLNEGLESIGRNFISNTAVKEITIPKSVESMSYALGGVKSLEKVIFENGMEQIPNNALSPEYSSDVMNVKEVVIPESVRTLGAGVFSGCSKMTGVTLPKSLKSIGSSTFSGCTSLAEISIPTGVTELGGSAFSGCISLSKIEMPGVKTVGGSAFWGCTSLTEVELPTSVKTVGSSAFSGCENLTKITLNEGLESIGRNFIRNTAIKEITIPKSVESMSYALGDVKSLEKVIFENGMEQIPNNALSPEYSSDVMNVKEVVIPESVRTLGAGVFSGCSKMTGVTLPKSLKSIGSSTFSGCTSLAEISIPMGVTELGGSVFSGCISLSKIEMPGVKTVGGSAFWGCSSLTEVELPTSVKTVGSAAFSGCENLINITLNEGLESIGSNFISNTAIKEITIPKSVKSMSYALVGVKSLEKVIFENGMEQIPDRALATYYSSDIMNVKEVVIPGSVKAVGRNAFTGYTGHLTLMSEDSGASIHAIDNELVYEAKKTGIFDSSDKLLARNRSSYTTSLSSSTTSGYVNLSLQYDFKEEAKESISTKGMRLKIKIPSAAELVSNTFKLNGKPYGVSADESGYIYVPVENTKGSATFSLKISAVSYLMTYAQIEYQYEGQNMCETIGIVNMAKKIFTLSVPDKTCKAQVDVLGFTEPGQSVQIYCEGNEAATVQASNTGSYMASISIPDPQEGSMYKIEAKAGFGEEESSAVAYTKYTQNSVQLTQCTMYYRNHSYDLLALAGTRPVISWASGAVFTFKVAFSDNSNIGDVNIVSTKGGEVNRLRAVWNEKQKAYIAAGFSGYVPGNITVEYGKNLGVGFEGNQVSLGEPFDEKNMIGYESKVTLKDIPEFYYLKEQEENVSKLPTDDYERIDYDGSICYLSKEIEYRTRGDKTYACQEIFMKQGDGSYIRLCMGVGLENKQSSKKLWAKLAKREITDDLKELKSLLDLLSDVSEDTEDAEVYVLLEKTISTSMASVKPSSPEYTQLQMLQTKLEVTKMMYNSRKAYAKINKVIENASKYSNDPDTPLIPTDKITEKMKESVDKMNECTKNITNRQLREIMEEMTKRGWFSESLLDKVVDTLGKDRENADVSFNGRYSIDPSGYVYEAVTDNRIEGVTATIYYKDPENGAAVLWNAQEYDQSNPLYTDDLGYYAWDVPEGSWQVKFEKEGYDTVYSDWLPVPPPQMEVNKGMVSKAIPEIESLVAYSDHAEIIFSKYMIPDSVAALKLTGQDGKELSYSLEYSKKSTDESGTNFAKEYNLVFKDGKVLEPGTTCKVTVNNEIKSYAGIGMGVQERNSKVQKNIEILAPKEVSVQMGDVIEVPVSVVNASEEVKLSAVSESVEIASVEKVDNKSISVSGNMYGNVKITLSIEGIDIKKIIKVNVGTKSEVSEVKMKVILPQSVYTMSKGNSLEIVPEVYPDSGEKGKWTIEGKENIVSVDGNNFKAKKEGEVTARYSLTENPDIFAECKIIVKAKTNLGDINQDGKVNVFDLMQCLNHVAGKKLLTGDAFTAADIDGNGNVNLFDLMKILNHIAKGTAL